MAVETTDAELNMAVAEKLMGFMPENATVELERLNRYLTPEEAEIPIRWFKRPDRGWTTTEGLPHFSGDIAAAFTLEDRIAELDLRAEYAEALKDVVRISWKDRHSSPGLFGLIHATPRQRCEAAYAAAVAKETQ